MTEKRLKHWIPRIIVIVFVFLVAFFWLSSLGKSWERAYGEVSSGSNEPSVIESKPKLANPEEYLVLINGERAKAGVQPLVIDPALNETARLKVKDMIANNYYTHDRPDGSRKWIDFFIDSYRPGATVSENQAECYMDKFTTNDGWKGSPSHLAGINDDRMLYFGAYSEINPADGCMVVVNHFSN